MNFAPDADYSAAAAVARQLVALELYAKLPPLTLLNVNIPPLPLDQIKGFKVVRQGLREYNDELITRIDPYGRPYYWTRDRAHRRCERRRHRSGRRITDTCRSRPFT